MAELSETLEAARLAGVEVKIERGLSSVVLTLDGKRWILRDDAELVLMLALRLGDDTQRAWLARRLTLSASEFDDAGRASRSFQRRT